MKDHRLDSRGRRPRVVTALAVGAVMVIAAASAAQNQVMGGNVLDANLRQGSFGLNSPVYRGSTAFKNSQSIGQAYSAGWGSGIAAPTYRQSLSANTPRQSYLYQTPAGTSVVTAGRYGNYVDPLASTMYNPMRAPVTIQNYNPARGRGSTSSGIQIQPYGISSPLYSPYR